MGYFYVIDKWKKGYLPKTTVIPIPIDLFYFIYFLFKFKSMRYNINRYKFSLNFFYLQTILQNVASI